MQKQLVLYKLLSTVLFRITLLVWLQMFWENLRLPQLQEQQLCHQENLQFNKRKKLLKQPKNEGSSNKVDLLIYFLFKRIIVHNLDKLFYQINYIKLYFNY